MPYATSLMPTSTIFNFDMFNQCSVHYQLSPKELIAQTLSREEGVLNNTGALCIKTGKFTGRSPKDKFIVKDEISANSIDWNNFNIPIDEQYFLILREKMLNYLGQKDDIWIRDAYACADANYRVNIRVINEQPSSNLFVYNMFIRPEESELDNFKPDWHIIQAQEFKADSKIDGTHQQNFAIISFVHKTILIGGTGYTGEIKKGIFSVLNFVLPYQHKVLSMHCSANIGKQGDVAVFFGLSGTGKTTLSTDPNRQLIGDDEHGWTDNSVFNFEGGCYAKVIDLDEQKEPEIFKTIRRGALVENTVFFDDTNIINFIDKSITENTRVSYPINFIDNIAKPSIGGLPKNIFFLTCDAYGVLPPISKLSKAQAMYYFISGYTAKIAGTETGITEPKSTFSACFGAPFMPLHPAFYATMLGEKMEAHDVSVWMINTGWSGGGYGVGNRINLSITRAMITAVLNNEFETVAFEKHPIFGIQMPNYCTNVPKELLHPRDTWADKTAYDKAAKKLAQSFIDNFERYKLGVSADILLAAPNV